ncbi:MAG: hypothetical protein Q8Q14_16945 [Gemmatimonadales bacterium]|nr:hypothetical protein [Gemmatimonadales bacterium]
MDETPSWVHVPGADFPAIPQGKHRRCSMKRHVSLVALAVVFVIFAACSTKYARWPFRGPMFRVTNPTQNTLVVLARDGQGRELVTAKMTPSATHCFRWPFIHEIGYLMIAQGLDTLKTQAFEPWSADGWEWSGQLEPVANKDVCR